MRFIFEIIGKFLKADQKVTRVFVMVLYNNKLSLYYEEIITYNNNNEDM